MYSGVASSADYQPQSVTKTATPAYPAFTTPRRRVQPRPQRHASARIALHWQARRKQLVFRAALLSGMLHLRPRHSLAGGGAWGWFLPFFAVGPVGTGKPAALDQGDQGDQGFLVSSQDGPPVWSRLCPGATAGICKWRPPAADDRNKRRNSLMRVQGLQDRVAPVVERGKRMVPL